KRTTIGHLPVWKVHSCRVEVNNKENPDDESAENEEHDSARTSEIEGSEAKECAKDLEQPGRNGAAGVALLGHIRADERLGNGLWWSGHDRQHPVNAGDQLVTVVQLGPLDHADLGRHDFKPHRQSVCDYQRGL